MSADRIDWKCDACGKPVADGTGHIWIDVRDARRYEDAVQTWEKKHERTTPFGVAHSFTLADLDSFPEDVLWRVHHRKCDKTPESGAEYWFAIERCRMHAQLLDWTAHLMEKDWFRFTAWDRLIRRAIGNVDA